MEEMIEYLASKDKKHESFGEFLKSDTARENKAPGSKLWTMSAGKRPPIGHKDAQEHAARLRAIAILKAKRNEAAGSVKRKAAPLPETDVNVKRSKSETTASSKMDAIKEMLARKSAHHKEAEKEEADAIQRHLTGMEDREKVETFTTTCMEVKSVKVVTCKQVSVSQR
uniref:Mcm10 domain-containing protein n=1 Tax=Caenorhabditis japonica TaxID=281687 RepID=A0A8R1EM26_CAEJA